MTYDVKAYAKEVFKRANLSIEDWPEIFEKVVRNLDDFHQRQLNTTTRELIDFREMMSQNPKGM
jgi:hypothetical protein